MFEIQYIKLAKCELEYLDCKLNIFKTRKNLTVDIFIVILPGKKNSDRCLVLIFLSLVTVLVHSPFYIRHFFLNEPESRMSVPTVKLKTIKK